MNRVWKNAKFGPDPLAGGINKDGRGAKKGTTRAVMGNNGGDSADSINSKPERGGKKRTRRAVNKMMALGGSTVRLRQTQRIVQPTAPSGAERRCRSRHKRGRPRSQVGQGRLE